MKMQTDNQLTLKFPAPERKNLPVINEIARDSEGRVVTTKEDPDEFIRVKTENLVLRANHRVWSEQMERKIQNLKEEIKRLKNDSCRISETN